MSLTTTGIIGEGATLGYCTTSGGSYTNVAHLVSITRPSAEATDVKLSALDSAGIHQYIAGMTEQGQIEFKSLLSGTQDATLTGLYKTPYYWRITFADGTVTGSFLQMHGYLKKYGGGDEVPMDDKVESTYAIKLDGFGGAVTFTAGS